MCVTVESNAFNGGEEPGRRSGPHGTAAPGAGAPRDAAGAPRPPAAGGPGAQDALVAGTRDLMLAVVRLTAAGLSRSAWSAEGSGKGVRRAAYGR